MVSKAGIDIGSIIDTVVPKADREKCPSKEDYFLYCAQDRMIEAVSKNKLSDWYKRPVFQHIKLVDLKELSCKRYWDKWNRVDKDTLQQISLNCFERLWQIESPEAGLNLLVVRNAKLPLYYLVYPGNVHDSKHFETIMDEMFGIVCGLNKTKERLTVIIDKGINSEGNYTRIDEYSRFHLLPPIPLTLLRNLLLSHLIISRQSALPATND